MYATFGDNFTFIVKMDAILSHRFIVLAKGEVYKHYSYSITEGEGSRYIATHKEQCFENTIVILDSTIDFWIKEKYIIILHQ